ncbi:hypothetical protein IV203_035424 [Nitzschia inconspicua]|uniref:Uncharacterized protein n=1 Tax=Nitzschia inconspicua TaxID=303405 RepID=A0A9K3K578_9STRA|nr:hypothetical protein IV203_006785 [Nitzschia inconspicua]KAG7360325.1 hypothetical protein IV203_035424 [Nitzschia inconspicua]
MAMKSMKHLFRKGKQDRKIEETSHSQDDEEIVAVEESTELSKAGSEHTVNISDNVSLNVSIHDDGTVETDMKSEVTSHSALIKRTGPRKSRRALREQSKQALAIEFASSNHSTSASVDSSDDLADDASGVFINIPVTIKTEDKKDAKTSSRSRSRDAHRSHERAASRSRDRGPISSRKLSSRSRSSDRRRSRRDSTNSDDQVITDQPNVSKNTKTLSVSSKEKGFLSQLQRATNEEKQDELRETSAGTPPSPRPTDSEPEKLSEKCHEKCFDQQLREDNHSMEKLARERRARRSNSSDGRRRARSGSRDRVVAENDNKERRKSSRSVSRDGRHVSSNRNRTQRSKDTKIPSNQGTSSERLGSSSQHTAARSRSTDRRGVRRTKSNVCKGSTEGIKMLFGEGLQRRQSEENTNVASNIQQPIEEKNLDDLLIGPDICQVREKDSTIDNEMISPLQQACDKSESKNSALSERPYRATGRSMSRVRMSRNRSSRSRSAEKTENKFPEKSEVEIPLNCEAKRIETTSTETPSRMDEMTKAVVSEKDGNEKQVQKVSVVFRDEDGVAGPTERVYGSVDKGKESEIGHATMLLKLGDQEVSPSKAAVPSAKESKDIEDSSQHHPKLETKILTKENGGNLSDDAALGKPDGKGPGRLSDKDKRRAARNARREKRQTIARESAPGESNLTALLGMIGSSADDFKSNNISNTDELFEIQPKCSVDFFQSISAPHDSGEKMKSTSTVTGRGVASSKSCDDTKELIGNTDELKDKRHSVVRRSSSDDAFDCMCQASTARKSQKSQSKAISLRNVLSQSDHVTDGRRRHDSEENGDCLPILSLSGNSCDKSRRCSKKIQRQTIVEGEDEDVQLPPPSLAGDSFVKRGSKVVAKSLPSAPVDAFELLMQETTTLKVAESERKSKKIRRGKGVSDDGDCEESLAPPSLAGDAMAFSVRNKNAKGLTAVSECEESEADGEIKLPVITRKMSKKAKSFAVLQCEEDDDSFLDDLVGDNRKYEELKQKKRGSATLTMKKQASALDFVRKGSKKSVANKAKSARNVFDQTTTKVFSRRKEEGKGLLMA